ncbi:CLUMA_CG007434, isoform A [Clunio marinus]|uniref:CLUMA_CG007434, isoform A n=1 Tax=Clunio marinus TaxID=568069 RepID=A0A1J1I127_9DIPT|nr:CLUMA_CG007434, isoform A [Clunio marinus]
MKEESENKCAQNMNERYTSQESKKVFRCRLNMFVLHTRVITNRPKRRRLSEQILFEFKLSSVA